MKIEEEAEQEKEGLGEGRRQRAWQAGTVEAAF